MGSSARAHYWGPLLGFIPGYPPVVLCWGLQESTAGVWREVVCMEQSPKALLEVGGPTRLLAL